MLNPNELQKVFDEYVKTLSDKNESQDGGYWSDQENANEIFTGFVEWLKKSKHVPRYVAVTKIAGTEFVWTGSTWEPDWKKAEVFNDVEAYDKQFAGAGGVKRATL